MVYLANDSFSPKDAKRILVSAQQSVTPDIVVRDARVSELFVELDCSLPEGETLDELLSGLSKISAPTGHEEIREVHLDKEGSMARAIQCFNSQKYWSAHEALEQVWRTAIGSEKALLNGIILAAAALVHFQKDETEICLSILKRAEAKLHDASGSYHAIDIKALKANISQILTSGTITIFSI